MSFLASTTSGDVLLFVFQKSSVLDELSVRQVSRELNAALDSTEEQKVVIDLTPVELMTSSMIGELVKFKKRCDNDGISLALCGMSPEIKKLFKMTRLDKVFKIAKSREKALAS